MASICRTWFSSPSKPSLGTQCHSVPPLQRASRVANSPNGGPACAALLSHPLDHSASQATQIGDIQYYSCRRQMPLDTICVCSSFTQLLMYRVFHCDSRRRVAEDAFNRAWWHACENTSSPLRPPLQAPSMRVLINGQIPGSVTICLRITVDSVWEAGPFGRLKLIIRDDIGPVLKGQREKECQKRLFGVAVDAYADYMINTHTQSSLRRSLTDILNDWFFSLLVVSVPNFSLSARGLVAVSAQIIFATSNPHIIPWLHWVIIRSKSLLCGTYFWITRITQPTPLYRLFPCLQTLRLQLGWSRFSFQQNSPANTVTSFSCSTHQTWYSQSTYKARVISAHTFWISVNHLST